MISAIVLAVPLADQQAWALLREGARRLFHVLTLGLRAPLAPGALGLRGFIQRNSQFAS